jgi:Fe-S-cluster containining protein
VLDFLREGDILMVTRIDRLARSIGDLQDIVRAVRARGASLKATEQPIDTGTAAGKCFLDMLGVFAEFETNLRRERQLEGIAKAKAAGVYKGRPASIDATQVRAMKAQGLGGLGDRESAQDRPGVGLSGVGGRLGGEMIVADRKSPIFEHLVPERECGTCVACCKILEINKPELKKPAGTLCPHCTGTECGIYASRPHICRTWFCLWRRIDEMPDYLRPDRTGVVFSLGQDRPPRVAFERLYIVVRAISNRAAFDEPPIKAAIEMFVEQGDLPVWLSFEGTKLMIYPQPDFADAILNPTTTVRQALVPKAVAWRKKYGLD